MVTYFAVRHNHVLWLRQKAACDKTDRQAAMVLAISTHITEVTTELLGERLHHACILEIEVCQENQTSLPNCESCHAVLSGNSVVVIERIDDRTRSSCR